VDSSFGINYIASLENGRILLLTNLLSLIIWFCYAAPSNETATVHPYDISRYPKKGGFNLDLPSPNR
jgi:hypothetical protein